MSKNLSSHLQQFSFCFLTRLKLRAFVIGKGEDTVW